MTHGKSLNESWSAESIKVASDDPCGILQPNWPFKVCNLDKGHKGDHCNSVQAGIKILGVWWK